MSEPQTINLQPRVRHMELVQAALFSDFLGTPSYFWLIFISVVIGLLVLDLGFLHKGQKEIEAKESFILYAGYMAIAFAFGAWVWYARGAQSGLEFFTGYLIEQSLAMDNIFVIATVFAFLGIPRLYQHRVLFWGILGVIVFRAILIGVGAALVMSFQWILFLFGAFLVFTGLKMFKTSNEKPSLQDNWMLKLIKKNFRVTDRLHGEKFTIRQIDPKTGKIDRSPTGTGCSALMAVLHAKGLLKDGERYIGRSIIESRFIGEVAGLTTVGNHAAIIPTITGRAWITGQSTLMLDPDDPWPDGYKIADTWPIDAKD